MRISAAARFGGVVDNEADCLCALRTKSASQVRRHARRCTCGEEFEWAPLDGPGSLAVVLLAFALLMSPILVLIWLARQLLQDSIVLYAVA